MIEDFYKYFFHKTGHRMTPAQMSLFYLAEGRQNIFVQKTWKTGFSMFCAAYCEHIVQRGKEVVYVVPSQSMRANFIRKNPNFRPGRCVTVNSILYGAGSKDLIIFDEISGVGRLDHLLPCLVPNGFIIVGESVRARQKATMLKILFGHDIKIRNFK